MRWVNHIIALCCVFFCSIGFGTENTFYVLHTNPQQIAALNQTLSLVKQHAHAIRILISQAYQIDETGKVSGYLNPELAELAQAHSIKLMAMATNVGFDQAKVHQFLSSDTAQENALAFLLAECQKYHLYGVQFDFEMISIQDKAALTHFFQLAAERLHQAGFAVSYAVIPAFTDDLQSSLFLKKTYQNWSGAYDLKALGQCSDFVTIMAYNQHPEGTTPGPTASAAWVEAAIRQTLKYMPARKISLGIPAYSLYWYTGPAPFSTRVSTQRLEIAYLDAKNIIEKNHSKIAWNKIDKVHYAVYEHHWLNEYVYLEDVNSFKVKLSLAKKYHLRGVSIFRIGTEDKRIWRVIS